jgi:hypothetical protein
MPLEAVDRAYPDPVPENNLRLPDAVTIVHGPRRLLARCLLEGDKAARRMGLYLRVRHDFDELVFLNRHEAARGNWYPLPAMFNPASVTLDAENAFWLSGENADGEIVLTFGLRMHDWRTTNLAEQARALFYGEDRGQPCVVTAEAAQRISGIAVSGAAVWVRPDYRGRRLSRLVPRIGKACACARWPVDWTFGYVSRKHCELGMPARYGHRHVSYSVSYPGTPWLDLAIMYTSADEIYDDMTGFLETELSAASSNQPDSELMTGAGSTALEHIVTKTSSDRVFHGSSSLS